MKPVTTCDVLVVGSGPAGCAAVLHLTDAGRDILAIDKASFPRDKTCGDGLTTLALRELARLDLNPSSVPSWQVASRVILRAPHGREVVADLPPDGLFAAVAPRRELDAALFSMASERARVWTDTSFEALVGSTPEYVDVRTGRGIVRTRYVIAADGMWSQVRRSMGLTPAGYRGEWHAARQYASSVTGPAARDIYVWFDADLLPGYAWSFPLPNGRANVGYGVVRGADGKVPKTAGLWDDLVRRPHIAAALGPDVQFDGRPTAWPIPTRIDEMPLASGRVLFVGDAAAASDILTGEGIGQALLTGRLAAEAIEFGGADEPIATAERYRRTVRDELFADHRFSKRLGSAMSTTRGADTVLAIIGRSGGWGRRNFARWLWEDEPRAIALTPRRWHRAVLKRPGVTLRD